MKCAKTLVVISAVLMVVSLTPARGGANSSAAAKPALVIASLEHSFGDVKAGTPLLTRSRLRIRAKPISKFKT